MKLLVCIIVYDRINNLKHWLDCWQKCEHYGADLVVIHNRDKGQETYDYLCDDYNVKYIPRANIGYDIAAFSDICAGYYEIFYNMLPEWDRLLWITDDVFPMSLDFVKQFNNAMQLGVGIAAMEISTHVKKHIRTSAFMIDRTVAERLKFPADPITTKRQCYEFEHMGKNAFYEQIINMGLKVVQVAPNKTSPLWDSGYRWKLDRQKEHEAIFGKMPEQPKFISKEQHLMNDK